MTVQTGTIRGCTNVSSTFGGSGNREVWLLTVDFPAYSASGDSTTITGVGAAISARARDQKSRTLRWAAPAFAGIDASGVATYAVGTTGASQLAMEVSTDALNGVLGDAAGSEGNRAASQGVGLFVAVDAA